MSRLRISFFFSLLVLAVTATAQNQPQQDSTSKKSDVDIIHGDRVGQRTIDTCVYKILSGNVQLRQGKTLFNCDSVAINETTKILEAFGHVHINDNDSVHTYSDYLRYLMKDRKAFLKDNVRLTDGKGTLTTPTLDYDVPTKTGMYTQGGKLVSEKSVLTSQEGYYYGETRDALFKKNVKLVDPENNVTTDTLWFNTYTRKATFTVPTHIVNKAGTVIDTKDGYYDFNTKRNYFGKRPVIKDGSSILIADDIANDDSTGFGEARGNVIFRDTAQGTTLIANNVKTNKKESALLATENPVIILKQDNDSIYIAADTFYSAKLSSLIQSRYVANVRDSALLNDSIRQPYIITGKNGKDSSNDRFIEAYFNVRIYSDSLQAVCDSLFYSLSDTTFRLFRNPIVWAQRSQITGDTIYIFTANKKPHRMFAFDNSLAVNKVAVKDNFFNQVKGRTMNAYFKDGSIEWTHTKGSQAEYIYYALDEQNRYIGVNKSSSDVIDMYFENKEPTILKLFNAVKGNMSPMGQVDHDNMKLRGFRWQEDRRPKTKYELFGH
ncbi:OstA-like protein [Filimonas lacunae]|uniref:OstA-like protein n=1 Tax=Filimonas lacunae TaxID=477680 RepID=A0A173ME52_9BACT|nr:OstA-like protein [Filimonas lacunae]BAV05873.1 hypothetical protein FLA_1885 [Filimonas lacunae]SIT34584.1 OstA-like protein [Filimonas lacunae]